MTDEAITYYARKFFPHLTLKHAEICLRAILASFSSCPSVESPRA